MSNKKDKIVDAAIDAFSEKGIEKVTISEIVNKAGIAQGTFYLYFPSKLAVMPAIAEVMVKKMLGRLEDEVENVPIDRQIEQVINVIFKITSDYKELTKLIYAGLTQTQYIGDWEKIYSPLYSWVEDLLVEAKEAGSINPEINTEYIAKILIGTIEASAEQIFLYDSENTNHIDEYRDELQMFLMHAIGLRQ